MFFKKIELKNQTIKMLKMTQKGCMPRTNVANFPAPTVLVRAGPAPAILQFVQMLSACLRHSFFTPNKVACSVFCLFCCLFHGYAKEAI